MPRLEGFQWYDVYDNRPVSTGVQSSVIYGPNIDSPLLNN
jgi:hypothetical protein